MNAPTPKLARSALLGLLALLLLLAPTAACSSDAGDTEPAADTSDPEIAAGATADAGDVLPTDAADAIADGEVVEETGPKSTCAIGDPTVTGGTGGNACCVTWACIPEDLWMHCIGGSSGYSCQCGEGGDECAGGEYTAPASKLGNEACTSTLAEIAEVCAFSL